MMSVEQLRRVLGPIERRVRTMLMRGTLLRVDDAQDLQQMQVSRLEGETLEECERVGQYGFSSHPVRGSEVMIAQVGSNSDHHVIVGVDDRSRPRLTAGQAVVYDASGTKIVLDAGGNVMIHCAGSVTITGDLHIEGNATIAGTLNGHSP
jgi:phage baseplate assembly protein V